MRTPLKVDNKHGSDQDRRTPPELLDAIEVRFGKLVFDLAAQKGHAVRGLPCFTPEVNALTQDWLGDPPPGNRFLNPPFAQFPAFTKKAAAESAPGRPIIMLTLASVGANWYWDNVVPHAFTYAIDRVRFVGETQPFTKDVLINVFGFGSGGGLIQRWRTNVPKRPRGIIPP